MGSKDALQNLFSKDIFAQEGSSGTRFDHGQFENKTIPIYAPPYCMGKLAKEMTRGSKVPIWLKELKM